MALRPHTIAWWDLETTGSGPDSQILETGIVLTDMRLNILGTKSILHSAPMLSLRLIDVDPYVLGMHSENLLWDDLKKADVISPATADAEISDWLKMVNEGTQHIAFAGSGVAHFDRQFIARDYPRTNKLLTYWPLDIGVIRRMTELADIGSDPHAFTSLKPHRALDDALLAVKEARAWIDHQRELHNYEPWEYTDLRDALPEQC